MINGLGPMAPPVMMHSALSLADPMLHPHPTPHTQDVAPGAYYLEGVDGMWRRAYALRAG